MQHHPCDNLIKEHRWLPLINIPEHSQALIVTPGAETDNLTLLEGWLWHWPALTSVLELSKLPHIYTFNQSKMLEQGCDENINAVSLDHHLLTIEGKVELSINFQSSTSILGRLNRHSHDRLIRPTIRKVIRSCVAQTDAAECTPHSLQKSIHKELSALLTIHGINCQKFEITAIRSFIPEVPKQTPD